MVAMINASTLAGYTADPADLAVRLTE